MKANSNHSIYKENDVQCSQPQLILMIYDAAIRFTKEAITHMSAGRWADKGIAVESAFDCIAELRRALNLKDGGDVAKSLDRMYDLLSTKLTYGNVTKDIDQFHQVVNSLETLRSAWQEAFEQLKNQGYFKDAKLPETYALPVD